MLNEYYLIPCIQRSSSDDFDSEDDGQQRKSPVADITPPLWALEVSSPFLVRTSVHWT